MTREGANAVFVRSDSGIVDMDAMKGLIKAICDGQATDKAEQMAIVRAIAETSSTELLMAFTHSPALGQLGAWLQQNLTDEETLAILKLLRHLPVDVESLQASGVGKTVNKLRKRECSAVQQASIALLQDWKAMACATSGSSPAASAPAPLPACKRAQSPGAFDAEAKRARPAMFEEDDSLDSALSAQCPARKASLTSGNPRIRRSVPPVDVGVSSSRKGVQGSPSLSAHQSM
eukprot:5969074-Pleurochrysis_carterae.AAC.1